MFYLHKTSWMAKLNIKNINPMIQKSCSKYDFCNINLWVEKKVLESLILHLIIITTRHSHHISYLAERTQQHFGLKSVKHDLHLLRRQYFVSCILWQYTFDLWSGRKMEPFRKWLLMIYIIKQIIWKLLKRQMEKPRSKMVRFIDLKSCHDIKFEIFEKQTYY